MKTTDTERPSRGEQLPRGRGAPQRRPSPSFATRRPARIYIWHNHNTGSVRAAPQVRGSLRRPRRREGGQATAHCHGSPRIAAPLTTAPPPLSSSPNRTLSRFCKGETIAAASFPVLPTPRLVWEQEKERSKERPTFLHKLKAATGHNVLGCIPLGLDISMVHPSEKLFQTGSTKGIASALVTSFSRSRARVMSALRSACWCFGGSRRSEGHGEWFLFALLRWA